MIHIIQIVVNRNHSLYSYCDNLTACSNNMYNTALFYYRQVMFAMEKDEAQWSENERKVVSEIKETLPRMRGKHAMPTPESRYLSGEFLDAFFLASNNKDYTASGFPKQCAQNCISDMLASMTSYFENVKNYKDGTIANKPGLPRYRDSGSHRAVRFTNEDCVVYTRYRNKPLKRPELKVPKCKQRIPVPNFCGRLKQVTVSPFYDCYKIVITSDDSPEENTKDLPLPPLRTESPKRIIGIDIGVDNIAAITNNIGKECLLFKGNCLKSKNQWYNKTVARIVSEQTKGTTNKFKPTPEFNRVCRLRKCYILNFMHKVAIQIIRWCDDNNIDTIIIGENVGWKQELRMHKHQKQTFVYIPFDVLKDYISYLGANRGIRVIKTEESYTSKASFIDDDFIPTYGDENAYQAKFSGVRGPINYKGYTKAKKGKEKSQFRGIYRTKDGSYINSDLNGSANIIRKIIPNAFTELGVAPDFHNCKVVIHPDYESQKIAHNKQIENKNPDKFSRSKGKRLGRKAALKGMRLSA